MDFLVGFFIFLFGLIIGSFLNSVIYRISLPGFSFWKDLHSKSRSYCPYCRHKLIWTDLIPIFSFLFLQGKCRYCHKKISWQYPFVEILTAVIFLLILNHSAYVLKISSPFFNPYLALNTLFLLVISCFLIIIFAYDLKHSIIPDKILFPAIIITFFYRLFEVFNFDHVSFWGIQSYGEFALHSGDLGFWTFAPFLNYSFAALAAFSFFSSIFLISGGRWMGFGDCKLAILLGLLLGFPNILLALFLAFFFGAIIGVGLIFLNLCIQASKKGSTLLKLRKYWLKSQKNKLLMGLKSEIPFAPFLITGTFIAIFFGDVIIRWYLGSFV